MGLQFVACHHCHPYIFVVFTGFQCTVYTHSQEFVGVNFHMHTKHVYIKMWRARGVRNICICVCLAGFWIQCRVKCVMQPVV